MLEETANSLHSTYEQRLCQGTAREAQMLSVIQRLRADRVDDSAEIHMSSFDSKVRESIRSTRSVTQAVNRTPILESPTERISSEDIMRGLASLNAEN